MVAKILDVAILGAGPAGLSASIYLARANYKCTVFSSGAIGGALQEISKISNYPGFVGSGPELAEVMKGQTEAAGASIKYGKCAEVRIVEGNEARFVLKIDDEDVYARAVLVASGSEPKTLEFEPHKPVSYCALCDGDLVRGKNIAVVGGGNSAAQEALYLANLARKVTIIAHSALKAEKYLQERAAKAGNIEIIEHTEPTTEVLDQFDQIFIYIGKRPASSYLEMMSGEILDDQGYVLTGGGQRKHETVQPGLFAAGDVRAGLIHQVVTAAGDGAIAAIEIIDYLKSTSVN